jgi:membrane protein
METIRHTLVRFRRENMTDKAAGLTYYSVLSLFPAMLVLVALIGVLGQYPETTDKLLQIVQKLGPSSAVDTFRRPIEGIVRNKDSASALLGLGLVVALWSASGYVGAFMRTSNEIYEVPKERRLWRKLPVRVGLTVLMTVFLAAASIALVVTGPLAEAVGRVIGLESQTVTFWSIAKWPALVVVVTLAFALLYFGAPNARQPSFRTLLPGSLLAVVAWIIASIGFAAYVANFGSYNKTYGTLGAMIVLLLWIFITNNAVIMGALFNAERIRSRQGIRLEDDLGLDMRDPKGKAIGHFRSS